MTNLTPVVPSDIVGDQVREIRKRLGLSVDELAERCSVAGAPELTANALYLVEGGRRDKEGRRRRRITVDELLVLAFALDVSPIALLLPPRRGDYPLTSGIQADAENVYLWLTGDRRQPTDDPDSATGAHGWAMQEADEARRALRRTLPWLPGMTPDDHIRYANNYLYLVAQLLTRLDDGPNADLRKERAREAFAQMPVPDEGLQMILAKWDKEDSARQRTRQE
jgi:transcriptional regulator with XRE-family HTH domain